MNLEIKGTREMIITECSCLLWIGSHSNKVQIVSKNEQK